MTDPLLRHLSSLRSTLTAQALAAGFTRAEVQFNYPGFGGSNDPELYVQLWVGPTNASDHTGFIRCGFNEDDTLALLEAKAADWINARPDPLHQKAQAALDRLKAVVAEAAAIGLTYDSLMDHVASHYPEPPAHTVYTPEDIEVVEKFLVPGPEPLLGPADAVPGVDDETPPTGYVERF